MPSPNQNFVRKETILANVTDENAITALPVGQKLTTFDYFDGLGRPLQNVSMGTSPSNKDLVQFSTYDNDGWQTKSYLPYVASSSTGGFQPNPVSDQSSFYNNASKVSHDGRPFLENTAIEKSVLGRVKEAYGPGDDWKNTAHKSNQIFILNSTGNAVRLWQINTTTGLPSSTSNYADNSIYINKSTNEEGITRYEMKDFRGNVIETIQSTPDKDLITYYIYDDIGNLRFILPPAISGNLAPNQTDISTWAFQYKYDSHQHVIEEKGPGINNDWRYYVYDQWDRLIMKQDGAQRIKSPQEWTFIKYDVLVDLIRV